MVRIANLAKAFGRTHAVIDVSLEVEAGEVLGLLGPSGCGKTTILKCIAGLEQPTAGEIWLGERLVASALDSLPPERRNVGMVFQSYALWPHKTVFANTAYPLEVRRRPRDEIRRRVTEALTLVGLQALQQRYPAELSGGQQQRVAIARSIVYEPELLLFDEPLSNLDANTRVRVRGDLQRLLRRLGITAVYVTHDQAEAMAICDRIAVLHGGRLMQVGRPNDLYLRPASMEVAELIGSGNTLQGRVRALGGDGAEIEVEGLQLLSLQADGLKVGATVDLVLRREALRLSRHPTPGRNCWPARVRQGISFGSYQECLVDVGATEMIVNTTEGEWEAGSQGFVGIDPGRVIVFAKPPRE